MRPPLLPLLSGLLLALSLPPFPFGLLSFAALVPFALFVAEQEPGRAGTLAAARGGAWLGAVLFGVLLHWMAFSFPSRPATGGGAFLLAVAVLASVPALAGWLLHRGHRCAALPLWLVLPVSWTATEWLRGHLPGGLAFPWAGVALSLTAFPEVLAPARWVGEHGVTFWIVLVNGLLAEGVLRARQGRGRAARPAAAAAALALLPPLAGLAVDLARAPFPEGPPLRVALVQTSVSAEVRRDPERAAHAMAAALERLLAGVDPGAADLVVLPETTFLLRLETGQGRRHLDGLRSHARRLGVPLLVGGLGEGPGGRQHNSVFLVGGEGIRDRYDKRRLVPGVERAPLVSSGVLGALGDTTSYAVGRRRPPVRAGGVALGILVCYESAFGSLAREHRRSGASVLVNVTNDGWFGGGLPGSAARAQHVAHLVLRAVEARAAVVRSANGGVSMVVDPFGRSRAVAPAGAEAVRIETVRVALGVPPGVYLGGVVGPLSVLAALLLLLASRAGRRPPRPPLRS